VWISQDRQGQAAKEPKNVRAPPSPPRRRPEKQATSSSSTIPS